MPVELEQASHALGEFLKPTRLLYSPHLSEMGGCNVWFKLENEQPTGSFKVRGAFAKLLACEELDPDGPPDAYVAASTGNHGAAVAHAARELERSATIFVPKQASGAKIAKIAGRGARIVKLGEDCLESELAARQYADKKGMVYVSPYNDPDVIAGQGTLADELVEQFTSEPIDVVIASAGGGGLVGGIASKLKEYSPESRVIGVSPENSAALIDSIAAGEIVPDAGLPTLSDGTAGGLEPNSITLSLCRDRVDHFTTVSEDDIARTLRWFVSTHDMTIEGAAAVAISGFLKLRTNFADQNVVIVICGGNIDDASLNRVMTGV